MLKVNVTLWSVSLELEHFLKHKHLISEEWPHSVMRVGASSFPAVIPVQYWKWCRVYFFRSFFLGSISTFLASNYKISSVRAHFLTELTWNIESNYRFWKSSVYLCRKKICRYYIYISHYKIFIYILEKNLQFNFILL